MDAAWAACSDPTYWTSRSHVTMARIAAANGLAIALWTGTSYLVDMVAEYLAVEV